MSLAVWHRVYALVSGERRPLAGKCGGRAPASLQAGGRSHGFGRPAAPTALVRLLSEEAAGGTREGLRAGQFREECPMRCRAAAVTHLNGEVAHFIYVADARDEPTWQLSSNCGRCFASFERALVRIGRIYVSVVPELNSRDEFVVS